MSEDELYGLKVEFGDDEFVGVPIYMVVWLFSSSMGIGAEEAWGSEKVGQKDYSSGRGRDSS